jgi:hypothetical protein
MLKPLALLLFVAVVVDTITDLMHTSRKMPRLQIKLTKAARRLKKIDAVDIKG